MSEAAPTEIETSPPVDAVPVLTLPKAAAALVRNAYAKAEVILEYGSGGSTMLAAARSKGRVFSVESDQAWAARMERIIAAKGLADHTHIHWVDIGPTKTWGVPTNARAFRNWPSYAISVWDREDFAQPDVVLVDGRFRLACFLVTLLRCKAPLTLLWDDYVERTYYHRAEELLKPAEAVGRMVRFDVEPGLFKPEYLELLASSLLDTR